MTSRVDVFAKKEKRKQGDMNKVFSKRLLTARKMSSLSMSELANNTGISKQAISQYEKGEMTPSSENLIRIAKALNQKIDFFFRSSNVSDMILVGNIHFREENQIDQNELKEIKLKSIDFIENYFELEKIADNRDEFSNPISDIHISSKSDAKLAAKKIRKKWKLGDLPLRNILSILESKGVKIVEIKATSSFNGFAAWSGQVPLIVVNIGFDEITRVRFTTLHELGHLVLQISKEIDSTEVERICDEFASELLLPISVLVMEIGKNRTRISMQELIGVKEKYGISIQAIMVKLALNEIISWTVYNKWKEHYNDLRMEDNANFGEYIGKESSERFEQLLFKCISENKISLNKASSISKFTLPQLKVKASIDNNIYM